MIRYGDRAPKARRELHVFYVLDTSGSMRGTPISTLNRAMGNSLHALKETAQANGDAQIKISVLEFNSLCRWMQPDGPEYIEDFLWTNLTATGLTCIGAAIRELNSKLTRAGWLRSSTGLFMPIIIFMTDGFANDDWEKAVEEAKRNELFRDAIKIGFAIGDSPDFGMLEQVVGNPEAVIRTTDLDLFAEMLKFVTKRSSTCSIMPTIGGGDPSAQIVEEARIHARRSTSGMRIVDPSESMLQEKYGRDVSPWEIPDL